MLFTDCSRENGKNAVGANRVISEIENDQHFATAVVFKLSAKRLSCIVKKDRWSWSKRLKQIYEQRNEILNVALSASTRTSRSKTSKATTCIYKYKTKHTGKQVRDTWIDARGCVDNEGNRRRVKNIKTWEKGNACFNFPKWSFFWKPLWKPILFRNFSPDHTDLQNSGEHIRTKWMYSLS